MPWMPGRDLMSGVVVLDGDIEDGTLSWPADHGHVAGMTVGRGGSSSGILYVVLLFGRRGVAR